MKLNGSQIIMECLLEEGVDTVFGYPGGAVLNIYDALYEYQDKINHVCTSHEQGASHAADGYARATGKTGVCIATSGPGATNLVTGIATAYMDSIPVVAITGNVNLNLLGLDSFQEVDITGITMPITKHNFIVKKIEDLAETIRHAFSIANEGRKGPVLIDIPKDITAQVYEFIPKSKSPQITEQLERKMHLPVPKKMPEVDAEQFERAVSMINSSKRPFLYAGGGVIASDASEELAEFAEKIDAPVACSLMCQGGYDQKNGRYMGMLGMHGTKTSAEALKNCDLFIAVGTRFSDRVLCNANLFAQHCPVIQIDIDPAEISKQIDIDVKLIGEAKNVLQDLIDRVENNYHEDWMAEIAGWKAEYPLIQNQEHAEEITPQMLMETVRELTDDRDIITTEVGQHQMWAAQFYDYRKPRTFITSGGLGTMGYGLGAAIGAKYGCPDSRVINIAGDGSFHMNCIELSTAAKYKVPIVELIVNNEVLGMVRQWQKLFYGGRFSNTTLEKPTDYMKLAEAFGVRGYTIRKPSELKPVLEEALNLNEPVLINCIIDKDKNVLPMVPAGKSAEEPLLDI